jgi:hypothetical protein
MAQYSDGIWYPAKIKGTTATGYLVSFKGYERQPLHAVTHDQINQRLQNTDPSPAGNPPTKWMCELHNKDRKTPHNLAHVYDEEAQAMIWRCKPSKVCRTANSTQQTHERADTPEDEAGAREPDTVNEEKSGTPHPSLNTLTSLSALITPQDLEKQSPASGASQRQIARPPLDFSTFHDGSPRRRQPRPTETPPVRRVTGLTNHLRTQTPTSTIGPAGKASAQTHSAVAKLQALWKGRKARRDTIALFVQGPKTRLKLFFLPDTTTLQIKRKIQLRIPMQQLVLIYKDKEMEDNKTLQDYGLKPNDTIHLQPTMKAAAMPNTQPLPPYPPAGKFLNAPPQPTEMRGPDMLQDRNPTPNGNTAPTLSKVATTDNTTLNSLPMPPTAPIPQPENTDVIQFFVKTPKGNSLTMREPRNTTVGQLKALLRTITGIPVNQQRLSCTTHTNQQSSGIQAYQQRLSYAQDSATLSEVALQDRSTIQISMRIMGGMDMVKTAEQPTRSTSIYVLGLGIAVSLTSQGYTITDIHPNSPAGNDKRIRKGQLIKKVGDSFSSMRDIHSVGRALQGTPSTSVTLHLQSPPQPATFQIELIRHQNYPSDPTATLSDESEIRLAPPGTASQPLLEQGKDSLDRDSSPSENDCFSFLDPSPPPSSRSAEHRSPSLSHDKPQAPPPVDTDTLAVLRSISELLGGKPEGNYVPQKELAALIYAAIPGTVTDTKRHFTQAYGGRGTFTSFLRARKHPNGQSLLEWKDGTPIELRITSITASPSTSSTKSAKLAPHASGSRPAAAATCPPPRQDDLRNSLLRVTKKPRPPEKHRSQPPPHTTQLSTAEIQQAMIETCRIPRAPHTQTLAALLKTLEHHLQLPVNALEDRKDDITDWFDLLNRLHNATRLLQASNKLPLQSSLEHHLGLELGTLSPWHKAIINWTHPPNPTQKAPAIQPIPKAHQHHPAGADTTFTWQGTTYRKGDFLHISYNPSSNRSPTQLVRLLQINTLERPSQNRAAKPHNAPQLKIQEWTTTDEKNPSAGGYIDDKSKTLQLSLVVVV